MAITTIKTLRENLKKILKATEHLNENDLYIDDNATIINADNLKITTGYLCGCEFLPKEEAIKSGEDAIKYAKEKMELVNKMHTAMIKRVGLVKKLILKQEKEFKKIGAEYSESIEDYEKYISFWEAEIKKCKTTEPTTRVTNHQSLKVTIKNIQTNNN